MNTRKFKPREHENQKGQNSIESDLPHKGDINLETDERSIEYSIKPSESEVTWSNKSDSFAIMLGAVFGPLGYIYMERYLLAVICFLTVNFGLIGFIIVPLHNYLTIKKSREKIYGKHKK